MARMSTRRWVIFLPGLLVAGCSANEAVDGDTYVYTNTWLHTLGLFAIALTLMGFGAGITYDGIRKLSAPNKPRRRKQKRPPQPNTRGAIGGVIGGSLMAVFGFGILALGVPSSRLARITVGPDKLTIRDSLFWFAATTDEYPFSSLRSVEVTEQRVAARRGRRTRHTLHLYHAAGVETIEMGAIHKAAVPKLEEMLTAYTAASHLPDRLNADAASTITPPGGGILPFNPPDGAGFLPPEVLPAQLPKPNSAQALPAGPDASPPAGQLPPGAVPTGMPSRGFPSAGPPKERRQFNESELTPVPRQGRYEEGRQVLAKTGFGQTTGTIVKVYEQHVISVRLHRGEEVLVSMSDARPLGPPAPGPIAENIGDRLPTRAQPEPGTMLYAPFDRGWYPVEVVDSQPGRIAVQFQGEPVREEREYIGTPFLRAPKDPGKVTYIPPPGRGQP